MLPHFLKLCIRQFPGNGFKTSFASQLLSFSVLFVSAGFITIPLSTFPVNAAECGFNKEAACNVKLGSYYAVEPAPISGSKRPAVIFFHGGGGWGSRIFKLRKQMTDDFITRGYVVIAPNGKKRPGSRFGPGWSFIPQFPPHRDDLAFAREIIKDAEHRFNIDPERILMTGYSIGGSLTSYLACKDPTVAAAFAPVAGGFWKPHPTDCQGPVKLLHTHGWRDQTVPLEGRPLGQLKNGKGRVEQGDIYQTLHQWRIENKCSKYRADKFITEGPFWRRIWTHCAEGTALEFALHPGGHEVPEDWPMLAMDWFENITPNKETN